ncbi:hypothetical protein BX616_010836 [Lobosporangium transversale]|uniref:Uncharacterized protein n=1 Tax=Lobosporangium transversale TaxID=64571 RepID=A0A1Y2G884_9FUNG|nr:hypothetical protein BCR41DRAFT_426071 [Lobosporangium transversale]KAF9910548.1 hypothetical protein BX616_010836 [Lobosporangium transversale]ORZ04041.1 hypothetical protein BCR41DRAFT_426071 [Lobosporangium transversale]|eukprot:XP_021876318.1 hypothetical protein BCR41DRAFT_426071 [Lobosporangium transversale]
MTSEGIGTEPTAAVAAGVRNHDRNTVNDVQRPVTLTVTTASDSSNDSVTSPPEASTGIEGVFSTSNLLTSRGNPSDNNSNSNSDSNDSNNNNNNDNDVTGTGANTENTPISKSRSRSKSTSRQQQTLLTKALLSYISFFRVVQPLISLAAFGTITPVLAYFHTQTVFPTIQATLYVYTATLACCSLFFSIIYLMDVLLKKPLFWPFTNRHFRRTSRARIGGDLIVCMVFCGLWFLALIGLVIDSIGVDCGKLTGLQGILAVNGKSTRTITTVCQLEKATMGLAVASWACWMGVLLVLLYGHFWKRREVIAARLKERIARRRAAHDNHQSAGATGVSTAISPDATGGIVSTGSNVSGRGGAGIGGNNGGEHGGISSGGIQQQHSQQPSSVYGCQDMEGEVGLTGIICRYDDDQSSLNPTIRRHDHPENAA